ncbi:MAG TPA: glutamyl-tRNA reductase [Thermoanaerobaculia bacterium]|jgi:glutamyl-tRNA reductase|nr:glutamyl-tRNA reductase [Thermoanaerobaculia bacterium]
MPLILVGLNHRTAPVDVRERLDVPEPKLPDTTNALRNIEGIDGAAILSTCNRVEVVVSTRDEDVIEQLVDWLSARAGTTRTELEKHLYILRHADVVKHLFRVATGLDSMILGEPQIGGQFKKAFMTAQELGTLDTLLTQVYENTMRVSKKVRTDTGIGEHAVSVPYAAVELAKKIFGDLRGLQVLLLGTGDMGELTAEHLHQQQVKQVFVANRSHERAVELANRFEGSAVQFDRIEEHLGKCDIVIASTAAPYFVIEPSQVTRALDVRRNRSLFLIDLSVPRNIHPAVAEIDGAYLYNVDDLQQVADANLGLRQQKAGDAEQIVLREVEAFRKRLVAQDAVPTILELQQRLEAIRTAELEKCLRKVGPMSAEQHEAIEMFSTQLVNKILHYPILQLKDASDEPRERESLRNTIRKIFGLAK